MNWACYVFMLWFWWVGCGDASKMTDTDNVECLENLKEGAIFYGRALDLLDQEKNEEAGEAFRQGALLGDALCQGHYGDMFFFGTGGVKQDKRQAYYWFFKAAKNGCYDTACMLNDMNPKILEFDDPEKAVEFIFSKDSGSQGSDSKD